MSQPPESAVTSRVSLEEVQHVADLANLELTVEELPRMAHDLDAVLGFIAQLNELDTASLPPMAQVAEALAAARPPARPCGRTSFGLPWIASW